MAKIQRFLRKFQLQYCTAHPLTKAVMAAAILLSTITLVSLRMGRMDAQQRLADLQKQAVQVQQENEELSQRISQLGTITSIRQIAAEELGMVDPDTIIIEATD